MIEEVTFKVVGDPATKGSMRAITRQDGRVILKQDNEREETWAKTVGWAAKIAMAGKRLKTGPVRVDAAFTMPRPKKTKRRAPAGDLDKLTRSILDAMTEIVYVDDTLVVELHTWKVWVDEEEGFNEPGVGIRVVSL